MCVRTSATTEDIEGQDGRLDRRGKPQVLLGYGLW